MNAADEKAWHEYQKDLGPSGREGTMSAHIIKSAFLAGRASRNSEVEGLREFAEFIASHEISGSFRIEMDIIKRAKKALSKGDTDA